MVAKVDFYFAIDSRYSYLAATQIERIEREGRARVAWKPVALSLILDALGRSPFEGRPVSGQYESDYRDIDVKRWARHYNVPVAKPDWSKGDWMRMNLAAVAASRLGVCGPFVLALYRHVIGEGRPIERDADMAEIARNIGLAEDIEIIKAIDEPENAAQHKRHRDEALRAGVFGVPSFVAEDGAMFWGNDRIDLLIDHLRRI